MRYCMATESSLCPNASFSYSSWAFNICSMSISTPSPGLLGMLIFPSLILNGCFVNRSIPSCQIQCVSIAVIFRSEERRVGKECRFQWSADHEEKKESRWITHVGLG